MSDQDIFTDLLMASPTTTSSQISPTLTITQRTQSSRAINPSQATTDVSQMTKTRSSQSTTSRKTDDHPKSFETPSNDSPTNKKILQTCDYDNIHVVVCKQSEDYKLCCYDRTSTSSSKIDGDVISKRKNLLWELNLNPYIHDCDRKCEKFDSVFKIYFAIVKKSNETSEKVNCDSEINSNVLNLESDLFGVLFGNDAKIVKSSVLLVCINGMVYYKMLKCLSEIHQNTKLNLLCETKSHVIGMHSLTISLLLNESTNLHTDDYKAERNCLIVVSKNGKSFLVYESESNETIYQPFELFSQILSTTSDGKDLFYSTRSDVYKVSFKSQETMEGRSEYLQFDFDSIPLGYSGMKKLNVSYKDGNLQLIGQSGNSRKYLIDTSPTKIEKEKPPLLKDLLIGIKQTEVILNERSSEIDEWNSLLAELSLASHIVAEFYNTEIKSNRERENGIINFSTKKCGIANGVLDHLKCDVKCSCEDLGSRQNYAVMCTLTNNSSPTFSSNWSLVVRLVIYENLERLKICDIKSQTLSFTQGFTSQQFESVKFSLESSWLAQPVFDVDVILTFNIAILDTSSCVSVPIKRVSVDLFDLLRSNQNPSRKQSKVGKNLTDLTNDGIVQTLSQLRGQNSSEIQTLLEKSQNQVISVAVDLPVDIDDNPLTKLLSSCLSPPPPDQSSFTMCTPSGDVISFEVTDTHKLMMRCTNVAVLCQLRQAMERRHHKKQRRIETMTVKQARDFLKKLQELQWSLSATPMETNQGTDHRDAMDKVVAAYQTLRS